ncbi:hypothetical protein EK21DRAFT_88483 [Setomelanomma holmii]|uniref:Uncharacterized protein n=1 Tax=Setomelanomma holmii TaxID=210430 RepID=A0A9P4HAC3_9PLEO|nr:hypothetical protein EK21DRAFT_88483 [Setomelanomma holmii]
MSQVNHGPPYMPKTWSLGGHPTKSVDIPITAVLLALYIGSAAWHMTIFQKNNKRGHKFLFNAVLFGFSMARITTCVLRIASICLPTNIRLAIAASIFVAAGVLLIFIINLLWSQRILRSLHPRLGWHRSGNAFLTVIFALVVVTLVMVITTVVQSFYILRPRTLFIDRAIQLYGQTYFAIVSSLPFLVVGLALALPRRTPHESFGHGKLSVKIAVLLAGTFLVTLGAWYRCATSWQTPVLRTQPLPGYFSKACFYVFNFGVEILTVYMYALMRVDLRFHVPNGAKGPGSYSRLVTGEKQEAADLEAFEQNEDA